MNTTRKIGWAAALGATLLLVTACGGSNDDKPVTGQPSAREVPDSASASGAALVGFVQSLNSDDDAEPLTIKDAFAVPDDETGEPIPLS